MVRRSHFLLVPPPPPPSPILQVDENFTTLRWSWTDSLLLDEIANIEYAPGSTSFTIQYFQDPTTYGAKLSLSLVCRSIDEAARWVHALSGLQRVECVQHNLDMHQRARLKTAFRLVTKESKLRIAQQINFFNYLNLDLTPGELRDITSNAIDPPLLPGQPASWHDLLRIYARLSVHPTVQLLFDKRRLGDDLSEASLKAFWVDVQQGPETVGVEAVGGEVAGGATGGTTEKRCAIVGGVGVMEAETSDGRSRDLHALQGRLLAITGLRSGAGLAVSDLQRLLLSDENTAFDPFSQAREHDMTRPLSDYYINSSHNSYLTGNRCVYSRSEPVARSQPVSQLVRSPHGIHSGSQ